MLNKTDPTTDKRPSVVIKKYANRRLYNTETSTYVTLEDLAQMVRSDRDFVVYDAKSGDDLTHQVLTQIIVEQENRTDGPTLLPIPFLRQLIRFYDDSVSRMVPSYLQMSIEALAKEQERYRTQFQTLMQTTPFTPNPFQQHPFSKAAMEAMQEQTRKNLAMFEQAMSMWAPFTPPSQQGSGETAERAEARAESVVSGEIAELKEQLAAMQSKIEALSQKS